MSRRSQVLVVGAFIVALVAPMVLMAVGVRPDVDENRALTEAPSFEAATVANDATWAQLGDFLTDRLPLRDRAIETDARLRERFDFAEAAREGVPRGTDGWLYHHETLLDTCVGPAPAGFFDKGDRIPARAEAAGVDFRFVAIPDKVVVYPDHQQVGGLAGLLGLGDRRLPGCEQLWTDAFADGSADRPWLVDLTPTLTEAAERGDEQLYYRRDTHWTNAGARSYLEAVLEELEPGLFDPAEVVPSGREVGRGDLARMRGLESDETQPELVVERPGVTVVSSNVSPDDERNMQVVSSQVASDDAPLVEGITVLIGDSFTRQALPLFVPYFEELVFLQRPYLMENTIGDALEGRDADRIVIGQIQRNVAKGWYDELMQAVNVHLVDEHGRAG
jgi:hypothetical protein